MSKLQEIDFSATSTNNTDVDNQSTLGSAAADTINEIMQKMMKLRAAAITRHVVKTVGTYTPVKTDANQFWRCTGAVTLNLTAAATLSDGWSLWVRANGGAVTIDPNGAELIDGAATLVIPDGMAALVICTGTAFFTWDFPSALVINSGTATFPATAIGLNLYYETDSGIASIGPVAGGSTSLALGATNAGAYVVQVTITPTSTALRAALDLSGAAAGQIVFPATQNPSANANTLDDYEEGVWTPTLITDGVAFGAVTYDANVTGIYTKIGNLVYVSGYMETDAITVGGATGSILIGGFPFTSRTSSPQGCLSIGDSHGWNAQAPFFMVMKSNSATALLYKRIVVTGDATMSNVSVAGANTGANSNVLAFGGCYFV